MQIKVFKAPTMKEAMAAMKAELGDDAVILHSKKYKEGGLLGIGSKEVVEITAAVEESALPEKNISPRPAPKPTLFSNAANKYKTSGTAEGVAAAEKLDANLKSESEVAPKIPTPAERLRSLSVRPNLSEMDKNSPVTQSDSLSAKVAEQNKLPSIVKENPAPPSSFDEVLQENLEDEKPAEVESQSYAEILNSAEDEVDVSETQSAEEILQESEEIDEKVFEKDEGENISDAENLNSEAVVDGKIVDVAKVKEKIPEVEEENSETEEKNISEVAEENSDAEKEISENDSEENLETENNPETEEEISDADENIPEQTYSEGEENISEPVENHSEENSDAETETEKNISEEKISETEETEQAEPLPTQPGAELTQEQLAQAQAMMFAQFNQMQMAQVMQQAVAQAQAQAQLQVAEMAKQMREVHRQRLEDSGQAPPTAQVEQEEQDKIQRLEDEIAHMKALLAEVLGKEGKKGGVSLHEALRRQEVDEDILTEMATHAGAGDTLVDSKSARAKETLSAYLSEHLRFSDGIKLNRHGVRLVALLGTTGVGKTTTLAKIAAKFVLEHGVNAALITADTYRISAVDQLKTYSDILGLPLEIVYSPEELKAAIEKHKHKELILIDTAGRSQQNIQQMRELEEFLRVNTRIEKHLVISATTKFTDAQEIISKFSTVNPEKVIVTKIDETGSLGMIINLMRNKKLALSYITTGQSVPDDIELATADIFTDLILKKVVV